MTKICTLLLFLVTLLQPAQAQEQRLVRAFDHLEDLAEDLADAVKAGKLSTRQAWKKWRVANREVGKKLRAANKQVRQGKGRKQRHGKRKTPKKVEVLARQLKQAVQAGKISAAEAKKKWAALQRMQDRRLPPLETGEQPKARQKRQAPVQSGVASLERKLSEAVRAGKLSKRDAHAKLQAAQKKLAGHQRARKQDRKRGAEVLDVRKKLSDAVRAGRISERQAKERMEAYLKRRAAANRAKGKAKLDPELRNLRARIGALVRAGRMSKLEAQERMNAFLAQRAGAKQPPKMQVRRKRLEAARAQLEALVKAGRLSKKAAAQRYKALLQRMEAGAKKRKTWL